MMRRLLSCPVRAATFVLPSLPRLEDTIICWSFMDDRNIESGRHIGRVPHPQGTSMTESSNHATPASANGFLQKDGPTVLGNENAVPNRILIAEDATKNPSEVCLMWALQNLIKPGDSITVVGILHYINTPMGYRSSANLSDFLGTNRLALEAEISQKLAGFEDKFRSLAQLCDSRGVYLDITITAGTPMKSVLVREAVKLKATHVLLDRNLRKDRRFYKEQLECNVVAFSDKNQAECIREGSLDYISKTSGLPSGSKSPVSTMPDSMVSIVTSDGGSIVTSEILECTGEARASIQSLISISEESSCISFHVASNNERRSEDLFELLTECESLQWTSPSNSPSREDSFIDLFMLSSPDGATPVWTSLHGNQVDSLYARLSCEGVGLNAHIMSQPRSPMLSVARLSPDDKVGSASSTSSTYECSDQMPPAELHESANTVQPKRDSSKPSETHNSPSISRSNIKGADEESISSNLKKEESIEAEDNEMQRPLMVTKQVEETDDVWGKTLGQAPSLCSVCRLTSMELGRSPKVYDWSELKAAANGFGVDNLIAEGGYSFVYKGILQDGQTVAIKKLKSSSLHGDVQFSTEVEALSCAQHRNVVRLLGYGVTDCERALVYEYVCNGSLDQHLSGDNGAILDWSSRYKIAIGAARGLRYLHEECRVGCIVHRDMRPNNILLTHDFVPMVGDFGLAKLNSNPDAAIETQVVGALGFLAPEYVECGQVTSKIDVYSFGVVLLELITGRRAIDLQRPRGEISLLEWARPKLQHYRIHDLVDQKIHPSLNMNELNRMVKAASLCIKRDPQSRPGMSQVIRILEGDPFESPLESMEPECFARTSDGGHGLEEMAEPVAVADRLQMLASKRLSTVPRSWRNWVRA